MVLVVSRKTTRIALSTCTAALQCPVVVRIGVFVVQNGPYNGPVTSQFFFPLFKSAAILLHLICPGHLPFIPTCAVALRCSV